MKYFKNIKIGKINISRKWIIVIIIVLIIISYYSFKLLFKSPTEELVIEKVQTGEVLQEISETGSIKATENISLGFKSGGIISSIDVSVGDKVKKGDILAKLDSSQLLAQLRAVKATLNYTSNQYDTGLAGAKENLQSGYNSALNVLSDAQLKTYNALTVVINLQNNYFSDFAQDARDGKEKIATNLIKIESLLNKAEKSKSPEEIESAISGTLSSLNIIADSLKTIRDVLDTPYYYGRIPDSEKTTIDTQKTYINTAITNLTSSQTSINSYKIALQKAEDRVSNGEDNSSSQIEQAKANVDALQSQLNDNYLISPIDGIITDINIKRGGVASISQSAINLLSIEPFQIKVNIYEQDIVNVKVGNKVKINLVALPKQIFEGKVLFINPAETIVDNVVYYEVTVDFPNQPENIRSGMTADIVIETDKKDNVLRVSKNAVVQISGKETIQVLNGKKIENKTIITGLEGNDYLEILSGLNEGDRIVIGKK